MTSPGPIAVVRSISVTSAVAVALALGGTPAVVVAAAPEGIVPVAPNLPEGTPGSQRAPSPTEGDAGPSERATRPTPSPFATPTSTATPVSLRSPCAVAEGAGRTPTERAAIADANLAEAVAAYERSDHAAALAAVNLAECYQRRPSYDYMRAVIYAAIHDCARARLYADSFATTEPAEVDRQALAAELKECTPPPTPPAVPAPTSLSEIAGPSDLPQRRIGEPPPDLPRDDILGGVLLGVGLATTTVGGIVLGARSQPPQGAGSYADFQAQHRAFKRSTSIGGVLVAAGISVAIGGVIRYAVLARRARTGSVGLARR